MKIHCEAEKGAIHILGVIGVLVVIGLVTITVAAWNHITMLEKRVGYLETRIDIMDSQIKVLNLKNGI